MNIKLFTCNGFAENTYLLYDETNEGVIVDPGCNDEVERKRITDFIDSKKINLKRLLNTHCHIDHILGNRFIHDTFGLALESHKGEVPVLEAGETVASMYGINYDSSPPIEIFHDEGDIIEFGNSSLQVLYTPGHSPASISFYHEASKNLIAGDVLFNGSIGRTDLPGGNFDTLIKSIKDKFFVLDDDVNVYPGHGPYTTIGHEKRTNPFLT